MSRRSGGLLVSVSRTNGLHGVKYHLHDQEKKEGTECVPLKDPPRHLEVVRRPCLAGDLGVHSTVEVHDVCGDPMRQTIVIEGPGYGVMRDAAKGVLEVDQVDVKCVSIAFCVLESLVQDEIVFNCPGHPCEEHFLNRLVNDVVV